VRQLKPTSKRTIRYANGYGKTHTLLLNYDSRRNVFVKDGAQCKGHRLFIMQLINIVTPLLVMNDCGCQHIVTFHPPLPWTVTAAVKECDRRGLPSA
jgi:hypothetical protein